MPRNAGPVRDLHLLPLDERKAQPDRCQERWYRWIAARYAGKRVLDVGAGTGYGLPILRSAGAEAEGFDLLPAGDGVSLGRIEDYADRTWDVVVALDVLEHVEADGAFLRQLLRVAKEEVFFSTPNWRQWGCTNAFHVREYDPPELRALLGATNLPWLAWGINQNPALDPWQTFLPDSESASVFGVTISVPPTLRHSRENWLRLARVASGFGSVEDRLERLMVWVSAKVRPGTTHTGERDPLRILDRGEGWCDQTALVLVWLAREVLGLSGRVVSLRHEDGRSGHTAAEILVPDAGWAFLSGSEDFFLCFRRADGTILPAAEISETEADARSEFWRGRDGRGIGGFFSSGAVRSYYGPDGQLLEVSDESAAIPDPSPLPVVS